MQDKWSYLAFGKRAETVQTALATTIQQPEIMVSQAASDQQLIALWLHGRSVHTQRAYSADIARLLKHTGGKPLVATTLADLQGFADTQILYKIGGAPKPEHCTLLK
jgi:hypothetical protein